MTIADAARATRRYRKKGLLILNSETLKYEAGNEAKCDRLNLIAALEAIREPSEAMCSAAPKDDLKTAHGAVYVWRAMIDALIAEVKNNDA